MTQHLAALQPGQTAIIDRLESSFGLHQRLLALGFYPGRHVTMLRQFWFAGPVHIRVGTTEIMMRRCDAVNIKITGVASF